MQEKLGEFTYNPDNESSMANENGTPSLRKRSRSTIESSTYETEEPFKKDGGIALQRNEW